jgi:hypothetical protein
MSRNNHCDAGEPSPTAKKLAAKLFHTAKLIKPDGTVTPVEPKNGTDFSLDELHEFVGGYIEIVRPIDMPGVVMVINEEGKLKGLAHNAIASKFWHSGDPIVGNAILCHSSQVK